jgi:hypothetical protein
MRALVVDSMTKPTRLARQAARPRSTNLSLRACAPSALPATGYLVHPVWNVIAPTIARIARTKLKPTMAHVALAMLAGTVMKPQVIVHDAIPIAPLAGRRAVPA